MTNSLTAVSHSLENQWIANTESLDEQTSLLSPAEGTLVSVSMSAPGLTLNGFLGQALGVERFFWQAGREQTAYAGFGVAAEMMAWGNGRFKSIAQKAKQLFDGAHIFEDVSIRGGTPAVAAPRLFGGFAFRDDFTPDNTWAVFHPAHFILPHYQLTQLFNQNHDQNACQSWLTMNAIVPQEENVTAILPQLRGALAVRYQQLLAACKQASVPDSPPLQHMNYPMDYTAWNAMLSAAIDQMHEGSLQKVVLARVCEIWLQARVRVTAVLAHLNQNYPECYQFLFEPRPYHAFFGATPELLARVNGRTLHTMALAGSMQRGVDADHDEQFARALLQSSKDRHEHALVVDAMEQRLEPLAHDLEMPVEPQIYTLSYIHHLCTPIRATLQTTTGILPVVAALHPTPALGGTPREDALAFIRDAEPVPRGWYAAPIGWIDHKLDGEFGVAIRSAVSQRRRVWLYAGAGIVTDSEPQREWDETALKFRPMQRALGL
ncbi:MAG: isochorismate synthase [Anaerolineales bacterium]|nr:isochorismate synthase [Anaerolineales bacterium]